MNAELFQSLMFMIIITVFFYFMLIRPQEKRRKKIEAMQESLKVGDEIITNGGIIGKIININNDVLTIEASAEKTKLNIKRWAVIDVTNPK